MRVQDSSLAATASEGQGQPSPRVSEGQGHLVPSHMVPMAPWSNTDINTDLRCSRATWPSATVWTQMASWLWLEAQATRVRMALLAVWQLDQGFYVTFGITQILAAVGPRTQTWFSAVVAWSGSHHCPRWQYRPLRWAWPQQWHDCLILTWLQITGIQVVFDGIRNLRHHTDPGCGRTMTWKYSNETLYFVCQLLKNNF